MQYEVHQTDQTRYIDPKLKGSFKNSTSLTEKNVKNQQKFSRTCGFRGDLRKSLNFRFKPSKVNIVQLDFRQNPLKVEKWLFLALYRDYWMIQIFPGKSGRVSFLTLSSFNFIPSLVKIWDAVLQISRPHTHGVTYPGLTSTEVENCNVLSNLLNFSDFWLLWLFDFFDFVFS